MKKTFYTGFTTSLFLLLLCLITASATLAAPQDREYYEIRIYHLDNQQQEERVDNYLKNAYLPALQRAGIPRVGVFKPIDTEENDGRKIYVFIPFQSPEQFMQLPETLKQDQQYMSDGQDYIDAAHDNPPYSRFETILLLAFEGMPQFQESKLTNPASERIYELRSYEGATEALFRNKVKMFNEGEIEIFDRLGFSPVFYGEVRAGSNMPNLMYMTTHANTAAMEDNWQAFRDDERWNEMLAQEEYSNKVSHMDIILLHPTDYSGI